MHNNISRRQACLTKPKETKKHNPRRMCAQPARSVKISYVFFKRSSVAVAIRAQKGKGVGSTPRRHNRNTWAYKQLVRCDVIVRLSLSPTLPRTADRIVRTSYNRRTFYEQLFRRDVITKPNLYTNICFMDFKWMHGYTKKELYYSMERTFRARNGSNPWLMYLKATTQATLSQWRTSGHHTDTNKHVL